MPESAGDLGDPSPVASHVRIYPVNVAQVLGFIREHRSAILRGTGIGALLGVAFLFATPAVYTAQTQILIDPALPNVVEEDKRAPTTMDSQKLETEMAVLRSDVVALTTIDQLNLTEDPEFKVGMMSDYLPDWPVFADRKKAAKEVRAQRILAAFRKNLSVRRVGVSYAIDVYYTAGDPKLASKISNGIADAYMKFQIDSRNDAARVGSQWLEGRILELRASMNSASRKMQEMRASQNYSLPKSDPVRTSMTVGAPPSDQPLTLEDLESTASTYRRVYEAFLASYMAATQRQSFPISSAQIITRATPPLSQSRSLILITLMAAMVGAGAGAAIGFLRDRSA